MTNRPYSLQTVWHVIAGEAQLILINGCWIPPGFAFPVPCSCPYWLASMAYRDTEIKHHWHIKVFIRLFLITSMLFCDDKLNLFHVKSLYYVKMCNTPPRPSAHNRLHRLEWEWNNEEGSWAHVLNHAKLQIKSQAICIHQALFGLPAFLLTLLNHTFSVGVKQKQMKNDSQHEYPFLFCMPAIDDEWISYFVKKLANLLNIL